MKKAINLILIYSSIATIGLLIIFSSLVLVTGDAVAFNYLGAFSLAGVIQLLAAFLNRKKRYFYLFNWVGNRGYSGRHFYITDQKIRSFDDLEDVERHIEKEISLEWIGVGVRSFQLIKISYSPLYSTFDD